MEQKNTLLSAILTAVLVAAVFAGGYYFMNKVDLSGSSGGQQANISDTKVDNNNSLAIDAKTTDNKPMVNIETIKQGTGEATKNGDKLTVNYTGTLTDGTKFDSSLNPGRTPFSFTLGARQVIEGWEQGMLGMKIGEERKLTIPSELGYGANGAGGTIPPNATLIFDVTLLKIN